MVPNVHVRTYRPRQQVPSRVNRAAGEAPLISLSAASCKQLAILLAAALVLGLGLTGFLHGRIGEMQGRASILRQANTRIANENMRLLAERAQLSSKMRIVSLAAKRLHLYEPEQGQVRRM